MQDAAQDQTPTPGNTLRLGLDIGTASIGWALLECDPLSNPVRFLGMGVRIFNGHESSERLRGTVERRRARSMRRQVRRKHNRKEALRRLLVEENLFPSDENEANKIFDLDPWALRVRGLTEELAPFEIGRVLLHFAERRGFLSNRLDQPEKEKSDTDVSDNRDEPEFIQNADMPAAGTPGQRAYERLAEFDPMTTTTRPVRRAERPMRAEVEAEMREIWDTQARFKPDILTDHLLFGTEGERIYPLDRTKRRGGPRIARGLNEGEGQPKQAGSVTSDVGVHGVIFFQEKFWWDPATIGYCTLLGKPELRAPSADRRFQRFRILQSVNETKVRNRLNGNEEPLDPNQRARLVHALMEKKELTRAAIPALLDVDSERYELSLERSPSDKLAGHEADTVLKWALGSKNLKLLADHDRTDIIDALLNEKLSDDQLTQALDEYGFDDTQMTKLMRAPSRLPSGRARYSRKAIEQLLPHLEQGTTLTEAKAAAELAHELASDRFTAEKFLPTAHDMEFRNPYVSRAVSHVRQVVNELIRRFGRIDEMVVETTKELNKTATQLKDHNIEQKRRDKERASISSDLEAELHASPSPDQIRRVRLWQQQGGVCLYTGRTISKAQALSGNDTEIDHIVPRWRSLDDSLGNQTLCYASANADKGNRTPHEWLGNDKDRWEDFVLRVRQQDSRKERRYTSMETPEESVGFAAKDLPTTGFISREVREYLEVICPNVRAVKGSVTATIRKVLNFEALKYNEERMRTDHRNHALDASMLCLTTPALVKATADHLKGIAEHQRESKLDRMLAGLSPIKEQIPELYDEIVVSRAPKRKVTGSFHDQTQLAKRIDTEGKAILTKMVSIDSFFDPKTNGLIENTWNRIVDPSAKQRIADGLKTWPDGSPIKRVRMKPRDQVHIQRPNSDGTVAYFVPGDNAYFEIVGEAGKYEARRRTYLDVGNGSAQPELSLFRGDIVRLGGKYAGEWIVKSFEADNIALEKVEFAGQGRGPDHLRPAINTVLTSPVERLSVSPTGMVTVDWAINQPAPE